MDITPAAWAAMERRITRLEDHLEIQQLIATYGPAVDCGDAKAMTDLWTEGGTYSYAPDRVFEGRPGIAEVVEKGNHLTWMERGCGHLHTPPHIVITGDSAVATSHSQLMVHNPVSQQFDVHRVSASRWECIRTSDGWLVSVRTTRLLDGTPPARDLLASAVTRHSELADDE